jgi:8-oxo-dGTP pyrophosphatase MutT (NUDIX family)
MSEHPDPADVPIHPAATVMLIRDPDPAEGGGGSSGVEVFMLRRTTKAAFGAGMMVFPGGRVDDADGAPEVAACCIGLDEGSASERLGIPSGGLAYWAAVVRESFEEAGVLLARPRAGGRPTIDADDRRRVHDGELSMADLCARDDLVIDLSGIHYIDHWVTPLGERRRFDTRFFLAEVPGGQDLLHDDLETVDSLWVRPAEALAMFEDRRMTMMPPTVINLARLADYRSVAHGLEVAAASDRPTPIQPYLRHDAAGRMIGVSLPWDDDYEALGGTPPY